MSRNWLSTQEESDLLDEVAQQRQRLSARRFSVTPAQGALAGQYTQAYPWMSAGAVQSLTQAGLAPDSPAAISVADLAARDAAQQGEFDTPAENIPDAWYETLWNATSSWAKPIVRTGFTILATPFEELSALLTSAGVALFDETDAEGEFGLLSDIPGTFSALAGELAHPGDLISDFWENYTTKAAHSGGLLALQDLIQGKDVDLGTGFLPGGAIWEERQAAKHQLTLDGEFMTPGRLFARQVIEPGTPGYQFASGALDFTANIFLDPTNIAFTKLAQARKAVDSFQQIGLLRGVRKDVSVDGAVVHWLTSTTNGRKWIQQQTDNRDVIAAFKSFGSQDMGGLGMEAAERLASTTNTTQTFDIAREILGTTVRNRPNMRFVNRKLERHGRNEFGEMLGGGARVTEGDSSRLGFLHRAGLLDSTPDPDKLRTGVSRLREAMPTGTVSHRNIDNAVIQTDRWMANAGLPDSTRQKVLSKFTDVTGDPHTGRAAYLGGSQAVFKEAMEGAAGAVEEVLVNIHGVPKNRARNLTTLYGDTIEALRVFDLDDIGKHVDVLAPLQVRSAGALVDLTPMPGMIAELVGSVTFPNVREIRRLTPTIQAMQSLYDSNLWKGTIDGIRTVQSQAWVPLIILRNALFLRVAFDGQTRMAGAGYDSFISHPMDAIAWMSAHDPNSAHWRRFQKLLTSDKNPIAVKPRGTESLSGQAWDDFVWLQNSLERGSGGWRGNPGEMLTNNYVKTQYGEQGFYRGWATKLSHMANDPVYKRVAGGLMEGDLRSIGRAEATNVFDDVAEWFWRGTGSEWRKELGTIKDRSAMLGSRQAADDYLRKNYFEPFQRVTGGNPELAELVAQQTLGGINLRSTGHGNKLARLLEKTYDHAAPQWIGSPQTVRGGRTTIAGAALDHWGEMAFEKILTNPENYLTKSITFRQAYFQRAEELVSSMTREVQEQVVRRAREVGMDDAYLERLATQMLKGTGTQVDSLQKVDMLAGAWGMSETKSLLYHLSDRNQFMDMFKVVFPFGDVWQNVVTSWSKIVRQNPQVLRRFQQGMNGVRQPSILGEAETTPGTGEGFFHTDPSTGEEMFTYPFLGALTSKMLSLPEGSVEFTGNAAGLNMITTSVLPGFGPAITIPASHLLPNTPQWDGVRDTLMPFGEPDSIIGEFTPPWFDKIREAFSDPDPDNHRMFANTVADVMRVLAPERDLSTAEGQQTLLDEATFKARALYVIRGIAQFNLPTGPSFQWNARDVQGNLVPIKLLSEDLRKLTDAYDGDRQAAFTEWVQKYGVDNILAVIGKSTYIVQRPFSPEGDAWLRAHPDLERDYPTTIGLFAPEGKPGAFDYPAYMRAFETGALEAVSPAEQLALANNFLGRIQYENAKKLAELNSSPEMSVWLANVREQIAKDYPGFDGWVAESVTGKRPTTEQLIDELRQAALDPTLAATDAGQGLQIYLSAIAIADQMVAQLPGNVRRYQQAKAARPIRDWLRSVARQIIVDHPDFARLNTIFERELADDE